MATRLNSYFLVAVLVTLSGCGGKAYLVSPFDDSIFRDRAEERVESDVTVRAAVASADETRLVFGLALYDQGVQPIWLEVENRGDTQLRYAPVGTDQEYFAPLEIPYKNRSGYSDEGRAAMEQRFHALAMPRYVDAGETVSGFVMTHLDPGTKSFNVDLFAGNRSQRQTFFISVPGFVPDHAEVDFQGLYAAEQARDLDMEELYEYLRTLDCCSTDQTGELTGAPMNVAFIGDGPDVLYSLIRARWEETSRDDVSDVSGEPDHHWEGRIQDAVFRYHGSRRSDGFYELRTWLAPVTADGKLVWLAQLRHFYDHRWIESQPDPDLDGAAWFLVQNLWYSETLLKFGWIRGGENATYDDQKTDFQGISWFGEGVRVTLWLSGDPVSMIDVGSAEWDRWAEQ